jgi:hypothetical protein
MWDNGLIKNAPKLKHIIPIKKNKTSTKIKVTILA